MIYDQLKFIGGHNSSRKLVTIPLIINNQAVLGIIQQSRITQQTSQTPALVESITTGQIDTKVLKTGVCLVAIQTTTGSIFAINRKIDSNSIAGNKTTSIVYSLG